MRSPPACPYAILDEAARWASALAATCMMMTGTAQAAAPQASTASAHVAISGHVAPRCWLPPSTPVAIANVTRGAGSAATVRCNGNLKVRIDHRENAARSQALENVRNEAARLPPEFMNVTISPAA